MICDVCGYEHETAVFERPDGVIRCKVCADTVVFGRVITKAEEYTMGPVEYDRATEQWLDHPINKAVDENTD